MFPVVIMEILVFNEYDEMSLKKKDCESDDDDI